MRTEFEKAEASSEGKGQKRLDSLVGAPACRNGRGGVHEPSKRDREVLVRPIEEGLCSLSRIMQQHRTHFEVDANCISSGHRSGPAAVCASGIAKLERERIMFQVSPPFFGAAAGIPTPRMQSMPF